MEETRFEIEGRDGASIACYRWQGDEPPRAVVQVAHGMGEHALRYPAALEPLTQQGFVLYANDHRGHGRTAPDAAALGDYGPGGYDIVVDDMARLTDRAAADNPGLPIFFLGHSMGSMLGQGYLIHHAAKLAGAALSGSAAIDQLVQIAAHPEGLGALNAPFAPGRTGFEWLSRDEAEVDLYVADPLCGFGLTPESMMSLFGQAQRLAEPETLKRIPAGFPVYIFAGAEDPVNARGAWIAPLIERYTAAGLDVTARLYAGARHEVLNETNRAEVVGDLIDWLEKTLWRVEGAR
ncbi:Monoacylglycerol lipase [Alphaproteobacteria bacterium SO-S41]|nr:Monoacylglycerol lipase [Alphaproteobacteria bacterium SO-S41]